MKDLKLFIWKNSMDKLDKLRGKMKEQNVDLVVLSPGANLNWLLGVNPHADERPLFFFNIDELCLFSSRT